MKVVNVLITNYRIPVMVSEDGLLEINSCRRSRAPRRPVTQTCDPGVQHMTHGPEPDLPLSPPPDTGPAITRASKFAEKKNPTRYLSIASIPAFPGSRWGPPLAPILAALDATLIVHPSPVFVPARSCSVVLTCSAPHQHVSPLSGARL